MSGDIRLYFVKSFGSPHFHFTVPLQTLIPALIQVQDVPIPALIHVMDVQSWTLKTTHPRQSPILPEGLFLRDGLNEAETC